ncbi:MAG TPA: ribosome silencing factor [Firmicutes bacterium]|nr:ribosome silencing factor [Bacillota bacterium]
MDAAELASLVCKVAEEKKAFDIVLLDVRKLTTVTDFFVVVSAENRKHAQAIADGIAEKVPQGVLDHVEGYDNSRWILMDMGSVIANVMLPEERAYYDLERLWSAAS